MAEMVLEKADTKNKFLCRQGISLPYPIKRVFCNTLINHVMTLHAASSMHSVLGVALVKS